MAPKLAALLAVVGFVCILLAALFGVSNLSNWFLDAAQGFLVVAVIVFVAYVIAGIVRDAQALK